MLLHLQPVEEGDVRRGVCEQRMLDLKKRHTPDPSIYKLLFDIQDDTFFFFFFFFFLNLLVII